MCGGRAYMGILYFPLNFAMIQILLYKTNKEEVYFKKMNKFSETG